MSSVGNGHQDVDINLAQLFQAVWDKKARILATTALVGSLAFVGSSMMSPTYQGDARILIESRQPDFTVQGAAAPTTAPVADELNVMSQVQLLQSVDLIKQVARDLKLYELPEFDPDTQPSAISDILVLLGIKSSPLDLAPEERVLKAFKEKLSVFQVDNSRVIGIEFSSKDPKLAAAVPNAMTDVYQQLQSGAKLDTNSEAARWLETEIANLREKVREAEQKVAEYRSASGLLPTSETSSFSSTQLANISSELARVRGERASAEATAQNVREALRAGRSTDTIEAIAGSEAIQRLKTTESQVQAQISDLSTSLLEGHPRMKALRAQLAGLRAQISSESTKIAASLENQAAIARERETQLIAQLNTVKADSARAGEDEVGLMALEREATAQRQLLETYLARYREATSKISADAIPADARVISRAIEPSEPVFPKVLPITIVATLATGILSAVVIMLMELFSGRALSPRTVSGGTARQRLEEDGQSVLPATPLMPPKRAETKAARPNAAFTMPEVEADEDLAEEMEEHLDLPKRRPASKDQPDHEFSIRSVAKHLLAQETRIAFVISPSGDDGSLATVELARELANRDTRLVLIDMTGTAAPSDAMTGNPDLPGITDLLCGSATFAEAIHPDLLSGADIIPQGTADIRQAMRGADRLSMIADALSDAYDMVLVECGPANAQGVAKLSRNDTHEIILSAPNPSTEELEDIMLAFEKVGYSDLVLMADGGFEPESDHRDAA
ncbi:chain-length determining protein [Peteryoungia desertarenae]|uniref:Chain-length determining protein n=1 Tax=Peteryoungia desertarenae TaxID=1813451 RepID=A0ABX6QP63_9HYPH|nr:Wzz/FepE/Etk N-terminal domain-containing protein [Peteryoungia desertarenae]QLF70072.1 chain-length determining protein [Peteryoungia desertarenae]